MTHEEPVCPECDCSWFQHVVTPDGESVQCMCCEDYDASSCIHVIVWRRDMGQEIIRDTDLV